MEKECRSVSSPRVPEQHLEPPPDHLPSPRWSPLVNLMPRLISSPTAPPQRSPVSAQELPSRPLLPKPLGTETVPETPASACRELEGPAPEPLQACISAKFDFNVVAFLSKWADDNLCLIRNISTGMAVAGVLLLARSIKLTSKFISPSEIPKEFIKNNVKLRGRLHRVTEKGLELEHIPIHIPLISSWRKQPCGVLLIKLAGVELTEAGHLWLRKELKPFQVLWFQLLARDNSSLLCCLLVNRGMYFTVSLNEEILRRGLGKTILIKELDHNSRVYWTIHKNLLKAELKAIRRGEGIWKEDTEKSSYIEKYKGQRVSESCETWQKIVKCWKISRGHIIGKHLKSRGVMYVYLRSIDEKAPNDQSFRLYNKKKSNGI